MSLNQTNKMAWLVETIRKAGRINFEEINQRWIDNEDMSRGKPLPKRTFHNWKNAIVDTFGLLIECEKFGDNCYYIANPDDLQGGGMEQWLLDTYAVSNSLQENKSLKDRILLENVPSGREYLDAIISAMRDGQVLQMTYYKYLEGEDKHYTIEPYCVKLFRQRWYMVANLRDKDRRLVFCLDRIRQLTPVQGELFVFPDDFSPAAYFGNCYGVITDTEIKAEYVVVKVTASQANYWRDLPLHPSQEEVERHGGYSIFRLFLRPSFDVEQELLWNRDFVEVLQPEWFRLKMADTIKRMGKNYKK